MCPQGYVCASESILKNWFSLNKQQPHPLLFSGICPSDWHVYEPKSAKKKVFCLLQWLGLPSVLIPKSNFFLQTLVSVFHVQVWFSLFLCRFLVHKTNSWYNFSSGLNCFVSMLFSGPWDWIGFYALICFPHICHRLLLCVELWIVIHSLIDRWLVERSSTTVPLGEKKDIGKKHVEIFPFKNDLYNFNRTTNKYWCPFLTWASKCSKPLSPPYLSSKMSWCQ